MSAILPLPILLPLIGAALSILVGRSRTAQRVIGLTVLSAVTVGPWSLMPGLTWAGPCPPKPADWRAPWATTMLPAGPPGPSPPVGAGVRRRSACPATGHVGR